MTSFYKLFGEDKLISMFILQILLKTVTCWVITFAPGLLEYLQNTPNSFLTSGLRIKALLRLLLYVCVYLTFCPGKGKWRYSF